MKSIRGLLVDAFTDEPYSGNPAGVVPDADGLDDAQMQAIAAELGASETAFLRSASDADRRLRYFTPTTEVDLCGHATIASIVHLADAGAITADEFTIKTNVGVLDVAVDADGTAWMTQSSPTVRTVSPDTERVAGALGVDPSAIDEVRQDLPLAVASTGLPFLVVPIDFLSELGRAAPDDAAVDALASEFDAVGIYAFTFDTLESQSTVHGRAFVPGAGVSEDPVTGTASGATGAYLHHVGAFDGGGSAPGTSDVSVAEGAPDELRFEQGDFEGRPGRVRVRVGERVRVGGTAARALDGELAVPRTDDDDILEAD
ncbi:PhzF family phenazine biosynthesis protein [Halanaeroarchaeum sulfurireducens]|uniref:Phenazine biosynthesis protein PhzF family n=1 Tax=Halanaeroarchaeum sulfurireducens TaxID=1604004 RepID=A0A0N9N907_9EURY|nr:PhzF family phenazine biosynthesis protein [Halanaeroarchaeum sulfurireducens]ALG81542.1 phenazine biosynthesis protein PhzF family [Halanaeroarchaeum sulfurireducens]